MRLIGEFQAEKQAFGFQTFLQSHGIPSLYDSTSQEIYRVWVVEEDDYDKAAAFYQEWQKDPHKELGPINPVQTTAPAPGHLAGHANWKVRMNASERRIPFLLNNFIIVLCGFLFFLTSFQTYHLEEERGSIVLDYELVPIAQRLFFDYPEYRVDFEKFFELYPVRTPEEMKELSPEAQACFKKIEKAPAWKGVAGMVVMRDWTLIEQLPNGTLFGKIRQGEFWRLFTPVLLHGGLLHILFNMAWLFMLGRQIEERIGKSRYILLSLLLGVLGNVAQYVVDGPDFLGYSGIITGMVGFIWMRQKIAPWEGYPLQRPVIIFITVFVVAMLALQVLSITFRFFHVGWFNTNIANTAHVIGGIFGAFLGRLPLFQRSHP